jgi:ribosomal protein L40E
MSQKSSLKCLFCLHLNPSDAVFCNGCDGQLNLQPCDQCGAVDARTATNCYKCRAEFPLPTAAGFDAPLTPAIAESKSTNPASIAPKVPDAELAHSSSGSTHSPPERQPIAEVVSQQKSATATWVQQRKPVSMLAILLVLITAVSAYWLHGSDAKPALKQGQQAGTQASGAPDLSERPASNRAEGMDTALQPVVTIQIGASNANTPATLPAPTGADAALSTGTPALTPPDVQTHQNLLAVEKCPPAVATLGLCSPDPH